MDGEFTDGSWIDGRRADGGVLGCGRVSGSVSGWMDENLGEWNNGLELMFFIADIMGNG